MCFEFRDAEYASVCKERDELKREVENLKQIVEKQARMNRTTAKMALDLDKMTEERDRWESDYRDLESAFDIADEQREIEKRGLKAELAVVKADRDRLQQAYNAMSKDLQTMFNRMTDAQNKIALLEKKATETCDTCGHYNGGVGDMVCHTCHGKNRWELGGQYGK